MLTINTQYHENTARRQPVRTNNDVEGWHCRLNVKANHGRLNLYQLIHLLHTESQLVDVSVRMLSECGTMRLQKNAYSKLHSRLHRLWNEYCDNSFCVILQKRKSENITSLAELTSTATFVIFLLVYRQTDTGRQQRPRLHIASCGKNLCFLIFDWFYDTYIF